MVTAILNNFKCNITYYLSRKLNRPLVVPEHFKISLTDDCNLQCRMCGCHETHRQYGANGLRSGEITDLIDQIAAWVLRTKIVFSEGEPLLRKDIFEILEYARCVGVENLGILSNGILVSQYIEQLMPYLFNNTISIVVSFDSLNPKVHNELRNSLSAWEKTKENLHILAALKKQHPQVSVNVITIICNQNLEELAELAAFIKSLGFDSLQFQPLLANNLKMAERKKSPFWVQEERLSLLDNAVDRLVVFKRDNHKFVRNSERNLTLTKKYYRGTVTRDDVTCASAYTTVLTSNQGTCNTCFSCYGDIKKKSLKYVLESKDRLTAYGKAQTCSWPCLLPCFCDR